MLKYTTKQRNNLRN